MATAAWELVVTRLVAERGDALLRYAYVVSGSQDDAADLVQDALVKTFGRLRNGLSLQSAEAYVRRAILTTHLDGGRRTQRWRRILHLTAAPEHHASPAESSDARIDLFGELARLTPRERACLVLRYYDDFTVADIAETLEISPGTVKRYLSDGLAKMSVALAGGSPHGPGSAPPPTALRSSTAATQGGSHAQR
ncbi:sigma-70 family RNA polymerase sigma factor [Salinibacterium hongtaonis]|uniref:sigma-70 family RNA polymerase sigma factor n=1 Tax=Homoserinimonas hongtaonis TaxID=2079791 RepID=UPI001E44F084|nr:sigma-70 family RNA polymerase sigma factor [Salinibacterium hongtaonis]